MSLAKMIERTEFDPGFCIESGDHWITFLDREQTIVSSNESCRSLLGLTPEEVIGKKLRTVVDLAHLSPLIVTGFCFRSEPILLGGRTLICDYVPTLEGDKATGGFLSISEDIAEPEEEESGLRAMVKSIGPFMDIASDGIIIVDRKGIITLVNQPFADVVGIRAQDMIGTHITKAYPNSKISRLPIVMESGKAEVGEPHRLNGRDVVVSRYPLIKDGQLIGALGKILFHDVREVTLLANKLNTLMKKDQESALGAISQNCEVNYDINSIIGHSKIMRLLKETLLRVADRGSNVLLVGESGTGKELFAHSIHAGSKRRYGPFIKVNCAAIPEHLLESELFGYAEGAFTGAKKEGQVGKFTLAHTGTIFLDEISDMSLSMQAKLLRILQEKEVTPLGSDKTIRIDTRVVAATNVNLEKLVKDGKFRQDLYYRLNIVALSIPPLRDRVEDIFLIAKHLVDLFNAEFGLSVLGLDAEAWDAIKSYDFPGNIRELRNVIESAFNVVMGPYIRKEDLPSYILQSSCHLSMAASGRSAGFDFASLVGKRPLQKILDDMEKQLLEEAIKQANGVKLNAATLLGISRPGLYKKLQKHGLQ